MHSKSFKTFDLDVDQEMACHLLGKPASLNSVLGTHVNVEGDSQLYQVVLC